MAVLSIADAERRVIEDKLWAARGRAIQGYASLEQALCAILSLCTDTKFDVAAAIFYKITAARARNDIVAKLLKKKFGGTYNLFWNSIFARLKGHLDTQRNNIVHWSALATIGSDEHDQMKVEVCLKPASYWDDPNGEFERLTAADMEAFEDECDFWARLIGQFGTIMSGSLDHVADFDKAPWLAIFQQPLAYPPPDSHPQARILATLQTQRPPSQTSVPPPSPPA
jgi:hypothetical protein